jgi:putative hydrolase of the HAD superfamily
MDVQGCTAHCPTPSGCDTLGSHLAVPFVGGICYGTVKNLSSTAHGCTMAQLHLPGDYGMTKRFSAVFFDAANTLLHPDPPVGELYARTARKYGLEVSGADVQEQFRRSWEALQATAVNDPVRYGIGETDGRRWWHALVAETFRPLGLPQPFEVFFDELYNLFADPHVWRVYPEVFAVLEALQSRGLIMGVLSNWDIRFGPLLEGLKLRTYFDHLVLSSVVGWEKPHRRIFESALDLVGFPAEEVLHVGDNYQQDVVGAQQAGMYAVWLRRRGAQTADCPVISSLDELVTLIDGLEKP